MARKNKNAGQPNRTAQMYRRADRVANNTKFKPVYGPGSEGLSNQPSPSEVQTKIVVRVAA